MRYRALAFDYDGTLATDGRVNDTTVDALDRAARSGRHLLLVSGRHLDDLERVFPRLDLFAMVVAENGGVLYDPRERERQPLAAAPPPQFVDRLRTRGVTPLGVGSVIVDTWQPHDVVVLETIRDLGLELQVTYNKGAVMVLPSGVNKATGLAHALRRLGLSPHNVVGVGDAENDHAFLAACECSVAVTNALPSLKERCDLVTVGSRGEGVEEIIGRVLQTDLGDPTPANAGPRRHHVLLGYRDVADDDSRGTAASTAATAGHDPEAEGDREKPDPEEVRLGPYGMRVLVAGPSGGGKSTATFALTERLVATGYQLCLVDPEGDYEQGVGSTSVIVGDQDSPPSVAAVLSALDQPEQSVVVNLLAIPLADRPEFFSHLLGQLATYSTKHSRPQWLVIDEAHHLLPHPLESQARNLLDQVGSYLLITVHPETVDRAVLGGLNSVIVVGGPSQQIFRIVAEQADTIAPDADEHLPPGRLSLWHVGDREAQRVRLAPATGERQRHRRKYALGMMGPHNSFWFRGPRGQLQLRAHNLAMFLQIGAGVDDETWLYHLTRGDYSRWLADVVGDARLADAVAAVENRAAPSADGTRQAIRKLITDQYTLAERPETYGRISALD